MKPGRDFDLLIAKEVMGHALHKQRNQYYEAAAKGTRPLAPYSSSVDSAFEVAQKLGVTLIPIEGGQWFAFVGEKNGWKDPGEFLRFLSDANFTRSGAAVGDNPAYCICLAAWNAVQQRGISQNATQTAVYS